MRTGILVGGAFASLAMAMPQLGDDRASLQENGLVQAGGKVTVTSGPTECSDADTVKRGDFVSMYYAGFIDASSKTGTPGASFGAVQEPSTFDFDIGLGNVIAGWDIGLLGLCKGDKATLVVPPSMGYGDDSSPSGRIPGGATLLFNVEVVAISAGEPMTGKCTTQYDCTTGLYCDDQGECSSCAYLETQPDGSFNKCDAIEQSCCSDAFLAQCSKMPKCDDTPHECDSQSDCTGGSYCDDNHNCVPCASLSTRDDGSFKVCDALDIHCCDTTFLTQCPSNPTGCCADDSSHPGLPSCASECTSALQAICFRSATPAVCSVCTGMDANGKPAMPPDECLTSAAMPEIAQFCQANTQ